MPKNESTSIPPSKLVTAYSSEDYIEVVAPKIYPREPPPSIRNGKNTYIDTRTGELKQYKNVSNKDKPLDQLCDEFSRKYQPLGRIIRANFVGDDTEKHITLTYDGVMIDKKQLGKDFKAFIDNFNYNYPDYDCVYVNIKELQQRLCLHCHLLLKNNNGKPLKISKEDIQNLWEHGGVKIKPIRNAVRLSFYFNVTLDEKKKQTLPHYPDKMKIYACSTEDTI